MTGSDTCIGGIRLGWDSDQSLLSDAWDDDELTGLLTETGRRVKSVAWSAVC